MSKSIFANLHHQLVVNGPKVLSLPSAQIPFALQKKLLSELLARIFCEAIEDGDLDFLEDKWLKVVVTDLKINLVLELC